MDEPAAARVQRLEDIESIRRLKSVHATRFDDAVNNGSTFEPVLEQFTPDAVWESKEFGRYSGVDEIRRLFDNYRRRVSFCLHYVLGDIIDIAEGRSTARGQWISWVPMTLDGVATFCATRDFDVYERTADGWRFKGVCVKVGFISPYDRGWAQERIPPNWKW